MRNFFVCTLSFSCICALAFSRLDRRDFEDNPAGTLEIIEGAVDSFSELGESIGESLDGVEETANNLKNILLPPDPATSTPTPSSTGGMDNSEPGSTETPTYSLHVTKEFGCDTDTNDASKAASKDDCQSRVNYIIGPLNDGPNLGIREALTALNLPVPYSVSEDPERGMAFCLAGLTKPEADQLRARQDVDFVAEDSLAEDDTVYEISDNGNGYLDHKTSSYGTRSVYEKLLMDYGTPAEEKLQKRSVIGIQRNAPSELVSLSTSPSNSKSSQDYYYSSEDGEAGEGITVYVIDKGLEPSNDEFRRGSVKLRWLFAMKATQTKSDDGRGHGSCTASKVAGHQYGVAKKAQIVMVKIDGHISSAIDAFGRIIQDLNERDRAGEPVRGYTVVTIQSGWVLDDSPDLLKKVDRLTQNRIRTLLNKYQVVVVASAGNAGKKKPQINQTPSKFSSIMPIITVGNVYPYGGKHPTSQDGPALTVSAVGVVRCAAPQGGNAFEYAVGTSFSAPIVAGLVADLLSRKKKGNILRRAGRSIPKAVRDEVVRLAWPRVAGGPTVAWNEIYPPPGPQPGL